MRNRDRETDRQRDRQRQKEREGACTVNHIDADIECLHS